MSEPGWGAVSAEGLDPRAYRKAILGGPGADLDWRRVHPRAGFQPGQGWIAWKDG